MIFFNVKQFIKHNKNYLWNLSVLIVKYHYIHNNG